MNLRPELERVGDEGVTIANLEPVDKLEPAIRLDASIINARHHLEERHAQRPRDDVVDSQRAKTQRHDVGEVKSEIRRDGAPERQSVGFSLKVQVEPSGQGCEHGHQARLSLGARRHAVATR